MRECSLPSHFLFCLLLTPRHPKFWPAVVAIAPLDFQDLSLKNNIFSTVLCQGRDGENSCPKYKQQKVAKKSQFACYYHHILAILTMLVITYSSPQKSFVGLNSKPLLWVLLSFNKLCKFQIPVTQLISNMHDSATHICFKRKCIIVLHNSSSF